MRILVIDDEESIRRGLARLLGAVNGWSVCGPFADGASALDFMRREGCDVIITDIRMPGMSGLALIEEVRRLCPGAPVIILSGYSDFRYAQQAIELGVRKYMTKPTNTRALMDALRQIEASLPPPPAAGSTPNLLVARAIQYMEANFQKKIGLREVADALFISPSYLSELFKRHAERNFSDYLLHLRMERAKAYLADVHYRVADVAGLVGFSDSRYFSSTFKRVYGLRPLEYRNRYAGRTPGEAAQGGESLLDSDKNRGETP